MPTFGGANFDDDTTAWQGVRGSINVDTEEVIYDAFPLTFDYSADAVDAQNNAINQPLVQSLQDIVSGNEWKLRRIVGKAFLWASGDETDSPVVQPALVDCAVGFIVCNTDDDAAPTTFFPEVNPLAQQSAEDPWIWRRRWLLNPYPNLPAAPVTGDSTIGNFGYSGWPGTTGGYGSVMDGPHIDQKTSRRIHRSERLYCVIACRAHLLTLGQDFAAFNLQYLIDYRLLGSLAPRSAGNRGNASR